MPLAAKRKDDLLNRRRVTAPQRRGYPLAEFPGINALVIA